jgi:hypothetical protein
VREGAVAAALLLEAAALLLGASVDTETGFFSTLRRTTFANNASNFIVPACMVAASFVDAVDNDSVGAVADAASARPSDNDSVDAIEDASDALARDSSRNIFSKTFPETASIKSGFADFDAIPRDSFVAGTFTDIGSNFVAKAVSSNIFASSDGCIPAAAPRSSSCFILFLIERMYSIFENYVCKVVYAIHIYKDVSNQFFS